MVLGVVAVASVFAGPGSVSVDALLGWTLSGTGWGIAAAVAGIASGLGALALRRPRAATPAAAAGAGPVAA